VPASSAATTSPVMPVAVSGYPNAADCAK
jgi:hypothetical protein